MKCNVFEIIDGTKILVTESEDGMLSFYGGRESSNWYFLVGFKGSIENLDEELVFSISNQNGEYISDCEEILDLGFEEELGRTGV